MPADFQEAAKWYEAAAKQGHLDAQCRIGTAYEHGFGVPENPTEAVKWYRLASEQGSLWGQYHLGLMYSEGKGTAKNEALGNSRVLQAAEKGLPDAQADMGSFLQHTDPKAALVWFRKASNQGNTSSMVAIGHMYEWGQGTPKDFVKAAEWFLKAAEAGDIYGEASLAHAYMDGKGVQKSYLHAYVWLLLAKADAPSSGMANTYEKSAQECEKHLKPAQISEGQRRAAEIWAKRNRN